MKRFIVILSFLATIFILVSNCSLADVPPIPASYYGSITIDGVAAAEGQKLDACIDDINKGTILTGVGIYGDKDNLRLSVEGSSSDEGKTVYFCIGPLRSNENVAWVSGDVKELPLTFTSGETDGCPCQSDETTNNNNNNGGGGGSGGTTIPPATKNISDNTSEPLTEEPESSEQVTIKENQEASFDFFSSKISNVKVLFNEPVENPSLTVEVFNEKPAKVSEISGSKIVYKYISIDKNFDSAKIKQATIKFEVETEWLAKNGVNSDNIILLHFNENGWEELPTTLTGMEGGFYIFEAETETLSLFAIVAQTKTTKYNVISIVTTVLITICVILIFLFIKKKYNNKK